MSSAEKFVKYLIQCIEDVAISTDDLHDAGRRTRRSRGTTAPV